MGGDGANGEETASDAQPPATSSTYKVLGELDASDGAGVLGRNTASGGTPIGVERAVPNASGGYGLSTPHDANVGGTLETAALGGGVTGDSQVTSLLGPGIGVSFGELGVESAAVGSGTGVLSGVTDSGIEYRSLSGSDGLSVTENSGTISLGQTSTTTDTASTFEENDVTIASSLRTRIVNGAITLANAVQFGRTGTSFNRTATVGVRLDVTSDISSVTATMQPTNNNVSTVYLQDSNKTTIASKPSPGPGRTITFDETLSAGSTYYLAIDNNGSTYEYGSYAVSGMYPVSTGVFEIAEDYNGFESFPGFSRIEAVGAVPNTVGDMTIEFPDVTPVSRWESVAFQHDPNGEKVRVDVEISDDGGSSWFGWSENPVSPGTDSSSIAPENRIRFGIRLKRINVSNEPRVTRLTRQYRP